MRKRELEVGARLGIHGRPAALLVQAAREVSDLKVNIYKGGEVADVKSIIAIIALGINRGDRIVLEVDGNGEEEVLDRFCDILLSPGEVEK
ncbi:MAG: HPr family phosphocarrier protein [Chloroflexi bacterium]|nr:HPr family phosphocarrier protein [Chloroflexota bacterium]